MAPRTVTRKQLAGAARAALGGGRRLEGVERVAGGSKKGVYRLVMDDATTAIAYLWDDAENFWPAAEGDDDLTDPFSPGLGLDLFQAAHARLDGLGVRVPAIRLLDRDGAYCHADLAIVEDLPGESLEELLARDPDAAAVVMVRLAQSLEVMRCYRAPAYGKVAVVDSGGTSRGMSCEAPALADELGGNTTAGTVGSGASRRFERRSGVIDHPDLGPVRTDSTVLTVPQGDLKLLVFTAEPGSADACKLAKLQTLSSEKRAACLTVTS